MTLSGIHRVTFRLVAQRLDQTAPPRTSSLLTALVILLTLSTTV